MSAVSTNIKGRIKASLDNKEFRARLVGDLATNPIYETMMDEIAELQRDRLMWEFVNGKKHPLFPDEHRLVELKNSAKAIFNKYYISIAASLGIIVGSDVMNSLRVIRESNNPEELMAKERLFRRRNGKWYARIKSQHGTRRVCLDTTDYETALQALKQSKFREIEVLGMAGKLDMAVINSVLVSEKRTVEEAIKEFILWMQDVRHLSRKTVWNYVTLFDIWRRHGRLPVDLNEVMPRHVNNLINGEHARKCRWSTRDLWLRQLSSFFKYCYKRGYCVRNPMIDVAVDLNSVPMHLMEQRASLPFTDEEITRIVDYPKTPPFFRLATAIGRWSGIRLIDICNLQPESFALPGFIVIWMQKTKRRVKVPIEPELVPYLSELPETENGYYFWRERLDIRDPENRSCLSMKFVEILSELGIMGRSFKSLRVTYAQMCERRGIRMDHIANRLGHTDEQMTLKHYSLSSTPVNVVPAAAA